MKRYVLAILLMYGISSCSRKTIPEETTTVTNNTPSSTASTTTGTTTASTGTTASSSLPAPNTKAVSAKEYSSGKRKVSGTSTPKFIIVDDRSAKSTADGKLYYDLGGYRYWKNNKDGKYYLDGIFSSLSEKSKTRKKSSN